MPLVEPLRDLRHQPGRPEIHAVERHLDLEDLLAVAHVDTPPDLHGAIEPAEPPPALRLQPGEQPAERGGTEPAHVAHVRADELVAQVGRQHPPRREHGRHARHDHVADLEQARDVGHVQPGGAAEGDEREVARVDAAADGHERDALGHVGVHHPGDALGGGQHVGAQRLRQRRQRALGGRDVERDAAAQEIPGIEQAADEIGVGDGGRGAATAVAGGAGIGAGALGTHPQDASGVDPGDRAAAGAEGVDVERRQRHPRDADRLLPRQRRLTALEQRDVGAGTAHVERDQVAAPGQLRHVATGGDAAGGPGQHGARRQPRRLADGRHPAVGLHDQDFALVAGRAQPGAEMREVARQGGTDVGVDDRRPHALVLLDLWQDLGRQRHVEIAPPAPDGAGGLALMHGVAI